MLEVDHKALVIENSGTSYATPMASIIRTEFLQVVSSCFLDNIVDCFLDFSFHFLSDLEQFVGTTEVFLFVESRISILGIGCVNLSCFLSNFKSTGIGHVFRAESKTCLVVLVSPEDI